MDGGKVNDMVKFAGLLDPAYQLTAFDFVQAGVIEAHESKCDWILSVIWCINYIMQSKNELFAHLSDERKFRTLVMDLAGHCEQLVTFQYVNRRDNGSLFRLRMLLIAYRDNIMNDVDEIKDEIIQLVLDSFTTLLNNSKVCFIEKSMQLDLYVYPVLCMFRDFDFHENQRSLALMQHESLVARRLQEYDSEFPSLGMRPLPLTNAAAVVASGR